MRLTGLVSSYEPDGRLFVTRVGRAGDPLPAPFAKPLSMGTTYRVWAAARAAALTDTKCASPLAKRPYDLRHAAVSTWLNAWVPPTQVAGWAGHTVNVHPRDYAKCVYGQEEVAKARIEVALGLTATDRGCRSAVRDCNFPTCSPRAAVDSRLGPITAGPYERAPNPRFRWLEALSARGGR